MHMELDLETLGVLLFQRSKGLERNLLPIMAMFYGILFRRILKVYRDIKLLNWLLNLTFRYY